MSGLSLIDGPVPAATAVLGLLGLMLLLARRPPAGLAVPAVAAALGLLVFLGVDWLATDVLALFPEALPASVRLWAGTGTAVLALAVGSFFGTRPRRKALAAVAAVLALLAVASRVNIYYERYPTLAALTGAAAEDLPVAVDDGRQALAEDAPAVERWSGTGGPSRLETAVIPGTASGFPARPGYLYLPPAYTSATPVRLPVLVLVAGQPGGPADFLDAGRLRELLDAFARQHGGLAPVTAVVDATGSDLGNSLCMDTKFGRADTYLARDVPDWIGDRLGVDTDHSRWAFGGFSFGGTCAVQMATRHPDVYPNFIDISGELEPAAAATREETVALCFDGDTAAFLAQTPMTLLAQRRYPDVWGYFAVGAQDTETVDWMGQVSTAARASGMTVRTQVVVDQGHSWGVPHESLGPGLAWLAQRMGLAR